MADENADPQLGAGENPHRKNKIRRKDRNHPDVAARRTARRAFEDSAMALARMPYYSEEHEIAAAKLRLEKAAIAWARARINARWQATNEDRQVPLVGLPAPAPAPKLVELPPEPPPGTMAPREEYRLEGPRGS